MTATLGGKAIERGRLTIPRRGAAHGDFALVDDAALTAGARTTLALGSLSLTGTVRPGGAFGGAAAYSWVAGAGSWGKVVASTPYHDDAGLLLSAVARDLAADAGEIGAALEVADRVLGRDWTRPTAPASDLLDALTGREWWIAADGVTHLGPRPSPAVTLQGLSVTSYDPNLRRATVELGDDGIAPLVPGIVLSAPGLPAPLSVGSVVVDVDAHRLTVELWGEAMGAEIMARIVDHLTAWRRYLPGNPYTVSNVGADLRVAVKPADARSSAYPDAPVLAHVPGVPGASCILQKGSAVVVSHLAGDPGSPVVTGYPLTGRLPIKVILAVDEGLCLGSGDGTHPVVVDNGLTDWLTAVRTGITSGGGTDPGPPPTIAAGKVRAI